VPSDRAITIFNAALLESVGSKGPVASPRPKTIFTGVNSDGAVYKLRYFLDPVAVSPSKARNTINANVMHHLTYAGLRPTYDRQDIFYEKMPPQKSWRNTEDRIDLLSAIDLFQGLSVELLGAIASRFQLRELKAGEALINQGDDGESLFILAEGLLEVFMQVGDEKRHVTLLRPGAFFGEMALLTGEKRSATITSSLESLVVELAKDSIMSLVTENPEVLKKMMSTIAKRRLKNKEIISLSGESFDEEIQKEEKNLMARVTNFFFGS
jgi:CRP-like cAMP-binding protein